MHYGSCLLDLVTPAKHCCSRVSRHSSTSGGPIFLPRTLEGWISSSQGANAERHETISSFWEWFVVQFLSVSQKPSHFYPIYFNGAQTQATAEPSLWTELYHRDIISNFGLFLTESVISDLLYFHRSTLNFMSVLCFLFYFDRLASCVQCFEFFFPLVSLSQISPSCVCLLSPIPFCIYAPCFPVSLCCVVPSQCVSFVLLVLPSLVPWFLNFLVWVSCFWFLV